MKKRILFEPKKKLNILDFCRLEKKKPSLKIEFGFGFFFFSGFDFYSKV